MTILSKILKKNSYIKNGCLNLFRAKRKYNKPHKPSRSFESGSNERRRLWIMNSGILLAVFGLCYASVPFYQMICETTGLVGDSNQKEYSIEKLAGKDKDSTN